MSWSDGFEAVLILHLRASLHTEADLRPTGVSSHLPLESSSARAACSLSTLGVGGVGGKMELGWEKRNPGEKIKAGWSCPGKPCKAADSVSWACPPSQLGPAQRLSCREKSSRQVPGNATGKMFLNIWGPSSPPCRLDRGHPSSSHTAFWLTQRRGYRSTQSEEQEEVQG